MNRKGASIAALGILASVLAFATFTNQKNALSQNYSPSAPAQIRTQNKPQTEKEAQDPSTNIPLQNIYTKQVTEIQSIPFQTIEQTDSNLVKGEEQISVLGINGSKTITYRVRYVNDKETSREKVFEIVAKEPTTQVKKIGTNSPPTPVSPSGPAGATALCEDGSFSYAEHHQGACSKHGGVDIWYR